MDKDNLNGSIVKIMEKYSCVLMVDKFSSRVGVGKGSVIESSPFAVGGLSFSIQLDTGGADPEAYISLFVNNLSSITAYLVVDLHIINRVVEPYPGFGPPALPGFSSFDDRETYHKVDIVEPGHRCGRRRFYPRWLLKDKHLKNDCILLRATIGLIVSYHNHLPLPQHSSSPQTCCILFQVEAHLYYAHHSIITTRCPALLQDYLHSKSNHIVLIPDVESRVFKAVLWFLHNNKLHEEDINAIAENSYGKKLFSQKMIAAADKFKLKDLRSHCESVLYYGASEDPGCYYQIEYNVKGLWENLSKKMKELIPQKIKAA